MRKNGFTLVELIAVLVILSIIALMATPNIIELMKSGKEKSFISEVEEMVSTAKYMYKNETVRSSKFVVDGENGFRISMNDLNGSLPDDDPFGYKYDKDYSYITIIEPSDELDGDSINKRTVKVHFKSCKKSNGADECHCLDSNDADHLTPEDIKDNCNS